MIVAPGIYDAFGARFVEMKSGPTILENLKRLTSEADAPCLVNMGAGGKLDELTPDDIGRLGLRIAIALDRPTIADVACYSYTVFAPEGGVSLKPFPAVRAWLARIQSLPRYLPIPVYDGAGGPLVE